MEFVIDRERQGSLSWVTLGIPGDDPGTFIIVGESVSWTYCGTCCPLECRGVDEDEGCLRLCLWVRLELLDMAEAVESLLDARGRCGWRCRAPMLDTSSRPPPMLNSLPVRSMLESKELLPVPVPRRSEPGVASRTLPDARLRPDMLEALDVRPPPFGSRSWSIMLPPTRE